MIDVRRPPPRHGRQRPAIHDFLVGSAKVMDGRPEPVLGRLTRGPAMTLKSRSFGHLVLFSAVRRAVGYAFDSESCTLTPNALRTVNAKLLASPEGSFRLSPSACFACIVFFIRVKFFLHDATNRQLPKY
jgi:hypothetical protein